MIAKQDFDTPGDALPRPHENCYWLLPGRVLAGEHPGTPAGVRAIEAAGVTHFIDLTADHDPVHRYAPATAAYERHPIADFGIPTVDGMRRTLDAIAAAVAGDGVVYFHCKAGIGRTGTVAGCLLVEHGFEAPEALALLQRKWRVAGQRFGSPVTPETDAQARFIATWGL